MKLRATDLTLIFAIAFLVCSSLLPWFILSRISDAKQYVTEVGDTAQRAEARHRMLISARQIAGRTSEYRLKLKEMSVSKDTPETAIQTIESYGRLSKTAVSIGNAEFGAEEGVFVPLVLSVAAEGPYANVLQLLTLIESAPFEVQVTEASLSREDKNWRLILSLRIPAKVS